MKPKHLQFRHIKIGEWFAFNRGVGLDNRKGRKVSALRFTRYDHTLGREVVSSAVNYTSPVRHTSPSLVDDSGMRIAETQHTEMPRYGLTSDGYSAFSGAPTSVMVRLAGETRWRRLMVWQFSNIGTAFVRIRGMPWIVRDCDLP